MFYDKGIPKNGAFFDFHQAKIVFMNTQYLLKIGHF